MASGKSTVAQLLAEKFDKGVHLRGDIFRKMIIRGREEMLPGSEGEAIRQLRLRYQLSVTAADSYYEAGFNVVLQDVILGDMLHETVAMIRNRPLYVIVLTPNQEAVLSREAARPKKGYGRWTVQALDQSLRHETARIGLWIDSSDLSAEETVEQIWERVWHEGRVSQSNAIPLIQAYQNDVQHYSQDQLSRITSDGVWSIGQMYDHLIVVAHEYLDQAEACADEVEEQELGKTSFGERLFQLGGFPPIKIKLPAELNAPPNNTDRIEDIVLRLDQVMQRLRELETIVEAINPKFKVKHDGFGWLNAREWYDLVEMHFRHHLRQKKELEQS
ncbi:DinB family protein [Paenibacillus guangzhouensis]|uniref:DinB family protein n=1 Tax=Paenibacillus guangzhouensis TaxID=1473112 RepID=UPI001266E9F5|nr:DinB family protein [Paenibacillus guangzhouensis]